MPGCYWRATAFRCRRAGWKKENGPFDAKSKRPQKNKKPVTAWLINQ